MAKRLSRGNLLLLTIVALVAVLFVPLPESGAPPPASRRPFIWNQDERWNAQEATFRELRRADCLGLSERIEEGLARADSLMQAAATGSLGPDAPILAEIEDLTFRLGPMIAACPDHAGEYLGRVAQLRTIAKDQSLSWNLADQSSRDRLYRLIYGGRAASEEIMLQLPHGALPALLLCDDEPSQTPSAQVLGVTLRSGDILVSRGGAPTSALIARGSDYPGNFSHVAMAYVDSVTGVPLLIESHIERGVTVSSVDEYLRDVKLRVMILRLRTDLPQMVADPMLPHRAAARALANARGRHVPYDFAMDREDSSAMFCSEVVSTPYRAEKLVLWKGLSTISSPGAASWLAAFGVRHFETLEPSDIEYDPQLRVVAEWRDPETLFKDHVDNAVIDAMLEGAEQGEALTYDWYLLPLGRLAKAYSAVLNLLGKEGPVPEGMSAAAGLRNKALSSRHSRIKEGLLRRAGEFRQANGYAPPYWELLAMARAEKAGL